MTTTQLPLFGATSMNMPGFVQAMKQFPGDLWRATADGFDSAFRGGWKAFKAQLPIKKGATSWTLTNPKAWPFEISYTPVPSHAKPDWSQFTARFGNISADGRKAGAAARGLEEGGTQGPRLGRWMAIPLGPARTASGRRRKNLKYPTQARTKKGVEFFATFRGSTGLLWAINPRRGRGRGPKKDRPEFRKPWYLLVRSSSLPAGYLGFHRTWNAIRGDTGRRIDRSVVRGIEAGFAGEQLQYKRGLRREIPY